MNEAMMPLFNYKRHVRVATPPFRESGRGGLPTESLLQLPGPERCLLTVFFFFFNFFFFF